MQDNEAITILLPTLYFVRSGGFYLDDGTIGGPHLSYLGLNGQFRSLTASNINTAYSLRFNENAAQPAYSYSHRLSAFPPRCLLRRIVIQLR